jgi:hypothetical protein
MKYKCLACKGQLQTKKLVYTTSLPVPAHMCSQCPCWVRRAVKTCTPGTQQTHNRHMYTHSQHTCRQHQHTHIPPHTPANRTNRHVPACRHARSVQCASHLEFKRLCQWDTAQKPCSCRDCCANHLSIVTCQAALHTVLPWHATGPAPPPAAPAHCQAVLSRRAEIAVCSTNCGQSSVRSVTCYWCSTGVTHHPSLWPKTHPPYPTTPQQHAHIHTHRAFSALGPR